MARGAFGAENSEPAGKAFRALSPTHSVPATPLILISDHTCRGSAWTGCICGIGVKLRGMGNPRPRAQGPLPLTLLPSRQPSKLGASRPGKTPPPPGVRMTQGGSRGLGQPCSWPPGGLYLQTPVPSPVKWGCNAILSSPRNLPGVQMDGFSAEQNSDHGKGREGGGMSASPPLPAPRVKGCLLPLQRLTPSSQPVETPEGRSHWREQHPSSILSQDGPSSQALWHPRGLGQEGGFQMDGGGGAWKPFSLYFTLWTSQELYGGLCLLPTDVRESDS